MCWWKPISVDSWGFILPRPSEELYKLYNCSPRGQEAEVFPHLHLSPINLALNLQTLISISELPLSLKRCSFARKKSSMRGRHKDLSRKQSVWSDLELPLSSRAGEGHTSLCSNDEEYHFPSPIIKFPPALIRWSTFLLSTSFQKNACFLDLIIIEFCSQIRFWSQVTILLKKHLLPNICFSKMKLNLEIPVVGAFTNQEIVYIQMLVEIQIGAWSKN